MKSILYAGAALMIGASVYGFVDYRQNSRNAEFKNLYEEKQPAVTPEPPKTEKAIVPVREISKVTKKSKKTAPVVVKTSNKELVTPVEVIEPEKPAVNTSQLAETITEKKYSEAKKKKRLSRKMFSRGGMREEYYMEKETKKVKNDKKL
jgi:hypothetical protein